MKTTTLAIDEIYASAWENAIKNTGELFHMDEKEAMDKWSFVQEMASELKLRFDLNGNIVKDEEIKDLYRTSLKVEITNGCKHYIRTVYKDIFGKLCFKDNGKTHYIFRKENGLYTSPWYIRVDFITDKTI